MGLNATPAADRIHIGFFGKRNAGKSSLINAVTRQPVSIVSDVEGTTTDPVYKAMELLPLGPVMLIDTPGIDDTGDLGEQRVARTKRVLNKTDIAVLVVDARKGMSEDEEQLLRLFEQKSIDHLVVYNQCDLASDIPDGVLAVSAKTGEGIGALLDRLSSFAANGPKTPLCADLLKPGDLVVLVVPIDESAPKGRLILPQQQAIRDILDAGAISVVAKDTEYAQTLLALDKRPKLVITDSQVFGPIAKQTPPDVMLTSFSILMARYKGLLSEAVRGVTKLSQLQDGNTVLIAEGCTHHRQCNDIGTVKLPKWIASYTGKQLQFEWVSGADFPEDLSRYAMIVHCGGCMLPAREVTYRMKCAADQGVPITNYGTAIAHINGILKRSLQVFPDLANLV